MPRRIVRLHPRRLVHGFRVGDEPSKKLNLYVAAAMIGYFEELAEDVGAGDVGDRHLGQIAERHAMEVLEPVPESYA